MGSLFLPNPLFLLIGGESSLPFLHRRGPLERRLFYLQLLLYKWYHLHSISVSRVQTRRLVFKSPQMRGGQWQCMGAWGYNLHPVIFQQVTFCNCWHTACLSWSEDRPQTGRNDSDIWAPHSLNIHYNKWSTSARLLVGKTSSTSEISM